MTIIDPVDVHLYIHSPTPIFRARVNLATPVYPLTALPFDTVTLGAYTDVQPDHFFTLGSTSGADDKGRGRTRYLATSTELTLPRTSRGRRDGELDVADNDYITVYDDFRMNVKHPYIAPDGTIYKDSNVPVDDGVIGNYNLKIPPKANAGPAFADYIDEITGLITVSFPGDTGFPSSAIADGASIASYAWDVKDGTITVGTAASSTITATFPAGFRWVGLTVVDSNNRPHTMRVPVLAVDPDDDVTVQNFTSLVISRTKEGQTLTFALLDQLLRADYPDGTMVMLWYDRPSGPGDRSHMQFVGWHKSDTVGIQGGEEATLRNTNWTCVDIAGRMEGLPSFPQTLTDELLRDEEEEPTTTWQYMNLPTLRKFIYYISLWQSNLLDKTDFLMTGYGADFPFVELQISGSSLWGQLQNAAGMFVPDRVITCNIQGQLAMPLDPMLQNAADRTTDVLIELTEDDWTEITFSYQREPKTHVLWGQATLTATNYVTVDDDEVISQVRSVAPGAAFGQGLSDSTHREQLAQSQDDLNDVTGHRYARDNNPYGFVNIRLPGHYAKTLDLATLKWAVIHISAEMAAQRGLPWTTHRGQIQTCTITHNFEEEGYTVDVSLTVELETVGTPASTWIPGEGVPA